MSHPSQRLNDVVHQRTRLGILAVLCEVDRADFTYLRASLAMTDGNLSRNLSRLHDAGYVEITKTIKPRPRTWLRITSDGRAALEAEFVALRALITRVERADTPSHSRGLRPAPSR